MDKGQPPPPSYEPQQAGHQPQNYPPPGAPYPPQQQQHHQQYPMQPQHQQPVTQVVVTQPTAFDRHPVTTICPHCRANVTTTVELSSGLLPWLICGGLVLFGCWLGCCIIPFLIDDLKDSVHHCPNCQQVVGQHKVMS